MTNQQQLNGLLDRWEEIREQGKDVSAEEICRDSPHLLIEFQAMADELLRIDRFMADEPSDDGSEELMAAGRYRPLRLHAHGGLGEVFVARDDELRREVALKRIRATGTADAVRRFQLEAEITGRLDHPGVVPVYGLGHDSAGRLYYAMRFIRGESLQKAIEGFHRNFPSQLGAGSSSTAFNKLIRRFVVVCQTVAYAHSQGIVHRDLKPANIMLGRYGETVVIDWGLAKQVELQPTPEAETVVFMPGSASTNGGASVLGEVKGSPAYMSPEQAEGRAIGESSDIYSLGATLYTILTAHMPFEGQPARVLLDRVKRGDFPHPRQWRGDVPRALEAICLKAMSREPSNRYATVLELAADLELWLDGSPVAAWREPWSDRTRRWMRKHRALTSSIAASALMALLGISAVLVVLGAFTIRLNAKKNEVEQTNADLTAAKQSLKDNIADLEKTKASLLKSTHDLLFARDEARTNRDKFLAVSMGMTQVFQDPAVLIYLGNPVYHAFVDGFFHQIDRIADEMPHDDFGDRIRLWRESVRIMTIQSDPRTGMPDDIRASLQTARSALQAAFQKHPEKDYLTIDLASAHVIEATRLAQTGDASAAQDAIERGLKFCERYARPGARYAKLIAYQSACLVAADATLPNFGDGARDWERIIGDANRALALMKKTESGEDSAAESNFGDAISSGLSALGWRSPNGAPPFSSTEAENQKIMQNYRDCYGPAMLLALKARCLYFLQRDAKAIEAAKSSLEISDHCSAALAQNRYILLVKAAAEETQGLVHQRSKQFALAWAAFRQAWGHAKESDAAPGSDDDRETLSLAEIGVAEAGVKYLSSPASLFLTAEDRLEIEQTSLRASVEYLAAPATEQDPATRLAMTRYRDVLRARSVGRDNATNPSGVPAFHGKIDDSNLPSPYLPEGIELYKPNDRGSK